jgi:hypothetical protein
LYLPAEFYDLFEILGLEIGNEKVALERFDGGEE